MSSVGTGSSQGLKVAASLGVGSRQTVLRWVNTLHSETVGLPEEMVATLYPEFYEYLTPFPDAYMRVLKTFSDFERVVQGTPGFDVDPDFETTDFYRVWKEFDDSFGFTSNDWLSTIRAKAQKMNARTLYYPEMVARAVRLSHAIDSVPLRESCRRVSVMVNDTATFMSHKATALTFAVIDDTLGEEYLPAMKMKRIRNRYSDFAEFTAKKMEGISE